MRRLLLTCLICAAALLVAPAGQAHAVGAYTIDEISTQLTVETNATTHIVEHQTLTFADNNAGVVWYLHVPEDGESVRIANIHVAPVDDGGTLLGDWTRLQLVDSNPERQGRNPGDTAAATLRTTKTQPWYSYSIADGMVRCYFPTGKMAATAKNAAEDGADEADEHQTYLIETDYTISHRVRAYRDVGELYWRYVHASLPADADNVTLQIDLPIPVDADPVAAASEITAWGHGPSDGTFAVGENGSVTYRIDHIARGNYAEAHIIFPVSWEDNLAPNGVNQFTELRRDAAEAEEAQWVDIRQREAAWDANVRLLFLGVGVVIILAATVGAVRHGRTPRARRALIRAAATFAIVGLGEQLFFRESLTTAVFAALAVVFALASLTLPSSLPSESEDEPADESAT